MEGKGIGEEREGGKGGEKGPSPHKKILAPPLHEWTCPSVQSHASNASELMNLGLCGFH